MNWPWWMLPARLVGRFRPRVLAAAAADATWLIRLPRLVVAIGPPLLVVLLAGIVSVFHATSQINHVAPHVDWLRFQVDDVYTESPLFIFGAIVIGVFSPALAVFLVVVFGVMDIAAAAYAGELLSSNRVANPAFTLVASVAGRLVSIWLLWLLCVEIPIFGRLLGISWRRLAWNRFAVATLVAVATGAFVLFWTQATAVLIRPVFTWSTLAQNSVRLEAIQPIQSAGLVFALAGALVAGAAALARGPSELLVGVRPQPAHPVPTGPLGLVLPSVKRVLIAGLLTISLGGLITTPLEAVVLFATLAAARPLAGFVADRTVLGTVVAALPPIARYALAGVLTFLAAAVLVPPLYGLAQTDPGRIPEFFSVILALVVGIIVVELATTPRSRSQAVTGTSSAVALLLLGGVWMVLSFALPMPAFADNCSGLTDCWSVIAGAIFAGFALPMMLAALSRDPPRPTPDQYTPPASPPYEPPPTPPPDDFGEYPEPPPGDYGHYPPTSPPPPPPKEYDREQEPLPGGWGKFF